MTKLEFTCSDEKSVFLLRAARLYDEGVKLEPVRHGRWMDCENYNDIAQCSECGLIRNIYKQEGWNYCPNCGAKMDAEVQDG